MMELTGRTLHGVNTADRRLSRAKYYSEHVRMGLAPGRFRERATGWEFKATQVPMSMRVERRRARARMAKASRRRNR